MSKNMQSRTPLSPNRASASLHRPPILSRLKTTARKLSELDVTSLPGIDSRVALSQSRARIVPLLALTALPSSLALKIAAQKVSGARRYVAPRG